MSPLAEYQARLDQRRQASGLLEKQFRRIGNARLAAGFAAVVVAFFVFGEVWISFWWLLVPLAVFRALVIVHARVVERLERSQRAIQFYERGMARLEDRWMGNGETGERFRNPNHVYSEDLDLFGKGSLFELLSIGPDARRRRLSGGLAAGARFPDEVAARHEAVRELRADARPARGSGRAWRHGPLGTRSGRRRSLGRSARGGIPIRHALYCASVRRRRRDFRSRLYMAGILTRTPVPGRAPVGNRAMRSSYWALKPSA